MLHMNLTTYIMQKLNSSSRFENDVNNDILCENAIHLLVVSFSSALIQQHPLHATHDNSTGQSTGTHTQTGMKIHCKRTVCAQT